MAYYDSYCPRPPGPELGDRTLTPARGPYRDHPIVPGRTVMRRSGDGTPSRRPAARYGPPGGGPY
eukprot:748848-Hanusia_phi.AAC.1